MSKNLILSGTENLTMSGMNSELKAQDNLECGNGIYAAYELAIEQRNDLLSAPEPLPYISRRALKRIPHPMPVPTVCSGCGGQVELVNNDEIYNGRSYGDWPFAYLCRPCDAYVGLHPNTDIPLGTLANKALREERKRSKAVFHDLIRSKGGSRTHWYRELAKQMRIGVDQCHFGMFGLERCEQAMTACRILFLQYRKRGAKS